MIDNTGARRNTNKVNAIALAKIGAAVFPSSGKTPLVPAYHTLDTTFTPDEREAEIAKYQDEHDGKTPKFLGCTTTIDTVKAMWRAFSDAVVSVACGPSKLVVLDADTGKNGPELIGRLFAENGGVPEGVFVSTTRSGGQHFVFADPENEFTNSPGRLEKDFGCDVRGRRGQFVAPGSIREDGKSYGDRTDLARFCRAFTSKQIPTLPSFVRNLIGSASQSDAPLSEADSGYRNAFEELENGERDDYASLFDPTLGRFSLETIFERRPDFKFFFDHPEDDRSSNRLKVASFLVGAYPKLRVCDYSVFCDEHEWMGEPDNRQLAREFVRAKRNPANVSEPSEGKAFGAVEDDHWKAYGGGEEARVALETKWGKERAARKARAERANERDESSAKDDSVKSKSKAARSAGIAPQHLSMRGIDAIPPRKFIYRRWLMRGAISVLIAPGGRGKSALTLSMAIDIACGVDRLGATLARPRGVFLYNAEDSLEEMERRAESYMDHHSFTPEQRELVQENLHIQSGVDGLLSFATADRFNVVVNGELVGDLVSYIKRHGIEVVSLDPLATLHGVDENNNIMMTHVADAFRRVVTETGVAMLIAHHARKVQRGSGQLDANDSRGASAIINSARIVLSINDLGSRADEFQITDEPWRYFAVSTGDKNNLSPRDPTVIVFKINSVQANNASGEFDADNSPAISLHRFVRQVGLGGYETEAVLAALEGAEPVGSDPRHANWIGRLIADAAGWDSDAKHVRASVKDIVAEWTRRRWIVAAVSEADGKGAKRRKPVGIFKRGDARPERRAFQFEPVSDED